MLKSGSVKGKRKVRVESKAPNGEPYEVFNGPQDFKGKEYGAIIKGPIVIPLHGEGLYWCSVFVDDVEITRMPLRISYLAVP